jgi:hypothetical protein
VLGVDADDIGVGDSSDGGDGSGIDRIGLEKVDDIPDPVREYLDGIDFAGWNYNLGYALVSPFHWMYLILFNTE